MIWYDRIHYNNGVNRMLRENKQEEDGREKLVFVTEEAHPVAVRL